jgi:O-acetyl-ADP-ribose deacetylase (regulator of RNase III)
MHRIERKESYVGIEAPSQLATVVREFDIKHKSLNFKFVLQRGPIHSFSSLTSSKTGIVVASNEFCSGKSGLLKAILDVGGCKLSDDVESLPKIDSRERRCLPGHAVQVTNGPYGNIQVSSVIFAVGPWRTSNSNSSMESITTLKSSYQQALQLAKESKLESVAFSCIGASRAGNSNMHRMEALQSGLNEIVTFHGYPELKEIHLFAYSSEEVEDLLRASENALREYPWMTLFTRNEIYSSENPYKNKKKLTHNSFSASSFESGKYIYLL